MKTNDFFEKSKFKNQKSKLHIKNQISDLRFLNYGSISPVTTLERSNQRNVCSLYPDLSGILSGIKTRTIYFVA